MPHVEVDDLTWGKSLVHPCTFINADELLDEIALAACESSHAKAAYEILREVSGDTIPTLQARLFLIDARNARP